MSDHKPIAPFIVGVPGKELTPETIAALKNLNPAGFILMGHNCFSPEQVKKLCASLKEISSFEEPLIFIDQEGGRVRRIKFFRGVNLSPQKIGSYYARSPKVGLELATLSAYVTAANLSDLGITANCFPLGDVLYDDADDVIGDRAYSEDPMSVAVLCGGAISGSVSGGVWPVMKHAPGHGRAEMDSHLGLPTVTASKAEIINEDCKPFIANNLCPFTMTAHISFPAFGCREPATQSSTMVSFLKNELDIKSILISDDLGMEALQGSLLDRVQKTLNAGVDLALYCGTLPSGEMVPNYLDQLNWLADKAIMPEALVSKIKALPPRGEVDMEEVKEASERLAFIVENV